MPLLQKVFLAHPASVEEGYWEHFGVANRFGWRLLTAGLACIIHGLLPCLFVTTGSQQVRSLYDEMVTNRIRHSKSASSGNSRLSKADIAKAETGNGLSLGLGVVLCVALASFALFGAPYLSLPPMLAVLLLGILASALVPQAALGLAAGIQWCSKQLLQIGVALLGLRVVTQDLLSLGGRSVMIVIVSIVLTIIGGLLLARIFRQRSDTAAIAATSVAICGASAALAASAVIPRREGLEKETSVIIVAVSILGTIAMLVYPWLARLLGLDGLQTSMFFGAAIHDVAQVAGAGFAVSANVGTHAVTVKMIRVACLLPVVAFIGWHMTRGRTAPNEDAVQVRGIPMFLIAFLVFAIISSAGMAPHWIVVAGQQIATPILMVAVAAIGLKTSFADMRTVPLSLLAVLVGQTLIQVCAVLAMVEFI